MSVKAQTLAPRPPLRLLWRSSLSLATAVTDGTSLYGITHDGYLSASTATDGTIRWITTSRYLPRRLTLAQNALYGYQPGVGLIGVSDQGGSYAERILYAIPQLADTTPVSQPVRLGDRVHVIVGDRLYAVDALNGGNLFSAPLNSEQPHSLFALGDDLLVVSGAGRPSRWRVASSGYSLIWDRGATGSRDLTERAALVSGTYLATTEPGGVSCCDINTGNLLWTRSGVGNLALAVSGNVLYAAGDRAGVWALNLANGATLWDRQYLAFVHDTPRVGLAVSEQSLWVGALLSNGYEPAALWAIKLSDGAFAWQAAGVNLTYGIGLPLVAGSQFFTYGSSAPVAAMTELNGTPGVLQEHIRQSPNPLRGPMAGFNPVEVALKLNVPAAISFIAWHERDERNAAIGPINYQPGTHTINYNAQWPRGWTDINQFGRLAFDIEESGSGLRYSQTLLVPVNTLPDIQHHWAKRSIETMLYYKHIGGYPDLTFRPDNLVTRAEASAIIARTLGLAKPSPGFHSKFTDIATHWAKDYIIALEEREIVGGFLEQDGTYTFRPDNNMTRAQEAKILVTAYSVPPAPAEFQTRFTDIVGHWAEASIRSLEIKGYVTGFRELDGSYTYRPEQSLTRAELSTMVVRILGLVRENE